MKTLWKTHNQQTIKPASGVERVLYIFADLSVIELYNSYNQCRAVSSTNFGHFSTESSEKHADLRLARREMWVKIKSSTK